MTAGDLVTRRFETEDCRSEAVYSACENYRYCLTRIWNDAGPRLAYIMLNPSTATEQKNDPTIERCQRRAVALGFGAMRIVNLFAWRETSPEALKKAGEPVGAANDAAIDAAAGWADRVFCAWGVHGSHLGQGAEVARRLAGLGHALECLGTTRAGEPRHPLYVSYGTRPAPFFPRALA